MHTSTPELHELRDFDSFTNYLFAGFGNKRGRHNLGLSVQSRLMTIDRKNSQVSGAHLAPTPEQADAYRQKLTRATLGNWSDEVVIGRLRPLAYRTLPQASAWIVDSSAIPKKGDKSVGVSHQYCGQLGKRANCQAFVSVHLSTTRLSLPLETELYLPEVWCDDLERRREAGVPDEVIYRTKAEIALDQIDRLLDAGCPKKTVVADADFGTAQYFRQGCAERGLTYMAGIRKHITVLRPRQLKDLPDAVMSVAEVARALPKAAWETITWREGSKGELSSQFASLRVTPAQGHHHGKVLEDEQWLLIEWPDDKDEPTNYWFSNFDRRCSKRRLVRKAHLRWRVERDYQDLKQEIGLGDYQGRTWTGFHHHLTLCMAAMVYLALQRRVFSPVERPVFGPDQARP